MKKRWLSILLVLALTVVLAVPAMAAEQVTTADGLKEAAAGGDVQLGADIALTDDVEVTGNLVLDLNGHDITGGKLVVNGGELKLMDSATSAYTSTDFGKVAVEGDVVPAFVANDGRRYIAIKDGDTYSAHRIYLAVKSVVLSTSKVGVNYKLILNCSEYVATQVTAYGAYFHTDAATITSGAKAVGKASVSAAASAGNPVVIQVQGQSVDTLNTNILASAFITLKSGATITSAAKGMSLADAVATLDAGFASLSEAEQINRVNYYEAHAALLSSLNLTMGNYKAHCICGANGNETHIGDCNGDEKLWVAYDPSGSTLPTAAGYYYISDANAVDGVVTLASSNNAVTTNIGTIYIDLNGLVLKTAYRMYMGNSTNAKWNITFTDSSANHTGKLLGTREKSQSGGILWSNYTGQNFAFYRVTVQCNSTTAGAAGAAIYSKSNVTLYKSVIHGGAAVTGGAVHINAKAAVMTLSDGSVIYGGTATTSGGAVEIDAGKLYINDTSEIVGGTAPKGGAVYGKTGNTYLYMNGGRICDGVATTGGGNVYFEAGADIYMTDGVITNGTAPSSTGGGNVHIEHNTACIFDMSGGSIYSPAVGRNIHANVATFKISGDAKIFDGQVCVFKTITLDTWEGNGLTSDGQHRPVQIFVNNGTVGTVLVTGTSNVNVSDYLDQFYLAGGEYDLAVSGNTLVYAAKAAE